jgi:hypothetical protein
VTKLIVAFTILRTRLKAAKYSNVWKTGVHTDTQQCLKDRSSHRHTAMSERREFTQTHSNVWKTGVHTDTQQGLKDRSSHRHSNVWKTGVHTDTQQCLKDRSSHRHTAMSERQEFTQTHSNVWKTGVHTDTHTFRLNSVPQLRNDLDYSASDRTKRKLESSQNSKNLNFSVLILKQQCNIQIQKEIGIDWRERKLIIKLYIDQSVNL